MDRRKIALILAIALLLLVLGGIGAYFYFSRSEPSVGVTGVIRNFFGTSDTTPLPGDTGKIPSGELGGENPSAGNTENNALPVPILRKISAAPVGGAVVFSRNGEDVVRYIERETGHVFDAKATSTENVRVSNTTIPRIQDAIWTESGNHVAIRYLDDDIETVRTYLAAVNVEEGQNEGSLTGVFLPNNITTITSRPNSEQFFYLYPTGNYYTGVRVEPNGERVTTALTSPLGEWSAAYPDGEELTLLSKPSAEAPGYWYTVEQNGELSRLVGGLYGLTARMSPDATEALVSESEGSRLYFEHLDLETNELTRLSPTTLPEKCAWSTLEAHTAYCLTPQNMPRGDYPDQWYQGLTSFNDAVWKLNTETGTASLISDLEQVGGEVIDGINPRLSTDERILIFTNKKDSSLWGLSIPPATSPMESGAEGVSI